ncbi:protein LSM14 homolog B isoform X2 [Trichogramma pretiosum]|uniref:protein LSM14 homolog B isoform X2 n=1 Tax=Trichogramma pretiosum TaxID=7493 RepID=UPI0006C9C96E|nr:protein LSM14 homolog B isoform X2 [Trichogramma pretiosum]
MSTGMPELGSKISLISKADIRYEGRLFTVDPQECTIALANVKSFGTEDRETQFPVMPQNQVYEYILFRGSDIKDIRVVNNSCTLPNDPAIVQMAMQPNSAGAYNSHSTNYNMMGQMSPHYGGPPYGVLDLISGNSRSNTPANMIQRLSPTVDQGVQTAQQAGANKANKQNLRNVLGHQDRDPHGSGRTSGMSQYSEGKQQHNQNKEHYQGPTNLRNRGGNNQGWGNQRGNMRNPRGPGNGGPGPRGRGNYRNALPGGKAKPIKFDNDYDFEQANTEFENLKSQISKMKIDGENDKNIDSGNETGVDNHEIEESAEESVCYDKTKSFFDNISCEAVERSKGRSQRTDWRTERKLNSETFGVSLTRRPPGSYRGGRGYYNNRGGNMGAYRNNQGGNQNYRGGYRGNRGNQNRNKQHPNHQQQPNNAQSNSGTTQSNNQSNRNATTENNTASVSAPAAASQPQQSNRLVTGTA